MKFLLVFSLVVSATGDNGGTSSYKDWLKYDGQVNSWGGRWIDKVNYKKWNQDYEYGTKDISEGYGRQQYNGDNSYLSNRNDYNEDIYETNRYRINKDQDWDENNEYNDDDLVGLGKNGREDLFRPCALEDWQCIRKYFAKNSKCSPKYGPAPDPLYLRRNTIYNQRFNLTQILPDLRVTGLGSIRVREFFVNKDTGNLVIALDFKDLNLTIPKAYYRYHRTAKESIVLSDYTTIEYSSGTFTAVIPKIPHLRLDLAEIHADIDDVTPKLFVGPKAANSTDPDVISAFAQLTTILPIAIQEAFLFQSQLFTAIYIQENICDFRLNIISF